MQVRCTGPGAPSPLLDRTAVARRSSHRPFIAVQWPPPDRRGAAQENTGGLQVVARDIVWDFIRSLPPGSHAVVHNGDGVFHSEAIGPGNPEAGVRVVRCGRHLAPRPGPNSSPEKSGQNYTRGYADMPPSPSSCIEGAGSSGCRADWGGGRLKSGPSTLQPARRPPTRNSPKQNTHRVGMRRNCAEDVT